MRSSGWSSHTWISDLIRTDRRACFLLATTEERTCDHTLRRQLSALLEPGSGFQPGTESVSRSILDFASSRTLRKKHLLSKPPSLWYFLEKQPELMKTKILTYDHILEHSTVPSFLNFRTGKEFSPFKKQTLFLIITNLNVDQSVCAVMFFNPIIKIKT